MIFSKNELTDHQRQVCHKILALIDMTSGFELIFVQCDIPLLREKLELYLETHDKTFSWTKVELKTAINSVRDEIISRQLRIDRETIVSIVGLENSIASSTKPADVVARLNLSRDLLPKDFQCPLFFWLPRYALQNIARFAPDIWSWRAGVFYFDSPDKGKENEIAFLKTMLQRFELSSASQRDLTQHIDNLLRLARLYIELAETHQALSYMQQVKDLCGELKDQGQVAECYGKVGEMYQLQGNKQKAQSYFNKALSIAKMITPDTVPSGFIATHEKAELSVSLQERIINFLVSIPNISKGAFQQALVYNAGLDRAVQSQTNFGLPAHIFVPLLISMLNSYGTLEDGRNPIIAVLESAKRYVGNSRKKDCDLLIKDLQDSQK